MNPLDLAKKVFKYKLDRTYWNTTLRLDNRKCTKKLCTCNLNVVRTLD